MNKQKFLSYAVVALVVMNIALTAFLFFKKPPHPRGGGMDRHGARPKKMLEKRLGFDASQSAAYEALIQTHKAKIANTEKSIRQAKDGLFGSIANPNPALKDSLINELGNLQKEIELAHYTHFMDLRGICKPEQMDDFNELTKRFGKIFGPKGVKKK